MSLFTNHRRLTPMRSREIYELNSSAARLVLGWTLHLGQWLDETKHPCGLSNRITDQVGYFNPMERVDHAWKLVEHFASPATPRIPAMLFRQSMEKCGAWYLSSSKEMACRITLRAIRVTVAAQYENLRTSPNLASHLIR
jgi:hypothetical protein